MSDISNTKWRRDYFRSNLGSVAGAKLRAHTDHDEILDFARCRLRDLWTALEKLRADVGGHAAYRAAVTALTDAEVALQRLAEETE